MSADILTERAAADRLRYLNRALTEILTSPDTDGGAIERARALAREWQEAWTDWERARG